jgi:predicted YcjX-like family ATPase
VASILNALDAVRPGASALVRRVFDPDIEKIVAGWPATFEQLRARSLGFQAHEPLVELVRAFVADDLEATRQERGLA